MYGTNYMDTDERLYHLQGEGTIFYSNIEYDNNENFPVYASLSVYLKNDTVAWEQLSLFSKNCLNGMY